MPRFLIDRFDAQGSARLAPRETRHMMDVLRHNVGDTIEVRDADGRRYQAVIRERTPQGASVERIEALPDQPSSLPDLTLFQAILKGKRMDVLVEKAAELGVNVIVPMTTARTIVRLDDGFTQKRRRWQRKIDSALKQCDRSTSVDLRDPVAYDEACSLFDQYDLVCVAALSDDAKALKDLLRSAPIGAFVAGIGDRPGRRLHASTELEAAGKTSAHLVSLGPHVLRAEDRRKSRHWPPSCTSSTTRPVKKGG